MQRPSLNWNGTKTSMHRMGYTLADTYIFISFVQPVVIEYILIISNHHWHIFQLKNIYICIGSSDNGSTCYSPPGSQQTSSRCSYLTKALAFMRIEILCIEFILSRVVATKSMSNVTHMLKMNAKYVPMNDYKLLNVQACSFRMFWNRGCNKS